MISSLIIIYHSDTVNIYQKNSKISNLCGFRVERKRRTIATESARSAKEKPKEQPLQDRFVLAEQKQFEKRQWPEEPSRSFIRNG